MWRFHIGVIKEKENYGQSCLEWYNNNYEFQRNRVIALTKLSSPCPCNLKQALKDPRFERYQDSSYCVRPRFPADGKSKGVLAS